MSSTNIKDSETSAERNIRWQNLITKIAEGDERALSEFYDESNWLVYSLALKILNNQYDAEEITLDVYRYIWSNASGYDSLRSNPSTWLVMLTRSRSIDKIRSRRPSSDSLDILETEIADSNNDAETEAVNSQNRKIIMSALSELTEKQRKVVELSYFYQYSQSEIADKLDIPLGSVKSTVRLATEKLKKTLATIK